MDAVAVQSYDRFLSANLAEAMPRWIRRLTPIALMLTAAWGAQPLQTQRASGVVRDSISALPIPGAVVSVLDASGHVSSRTIADSEGRFTILVPPSAVSLHVIRLGFHPRDEPLPQGRAPGDATLEVGMRQIPMLLTAMKVSARRFCPGSVDRADAFVLWEQARGGLLAAVVAREAKPAAMTTLVFERALAPFDETVRHLGLQARSGQTTRPFLASASPAEFAARGYMQEDASGRTYHAPDADVMLDETFAATHCLHIEAGNDTHRNAIGLAFEPVPGRDTLVDVTGVLWLDRDVPALRELEFRYTGLEPAATAAGAGGALSFRTMPNGVVFIDRWVVRVPVLTLAYGEGSNDRITTRDQTQRANRQNLRVSELLERGGAVTHASWPDGASFQDTSGRVNGRVVQKGKKPPQPAAHTLVFLDGAADTVATGDDGTFTLSPVLPGRYALKAMDTTLSEYTPRRSTAHTITVARDRSTDVVLEMPAVSDVLTQLCRGQKMPDRSSIVVGRVLPGSEAPLREFHLRASWQVDYGGDVRINPATESAAGKIAIFGADQIITPDPDGRFRVCGVVRERPIKLTVVQNGLSVADTVVFVYDSLIKRVEWRVSARAVGSTSGIAPGRGTSTLTGAVTRDSAGAPFAGVEVSVPALQRSTVTGADGTFRLTGLSAGEQVVEIRHLGFAPVRDTLLLAAGETLQRRFALVSRVVLLDTMRTTAAQPKYISPALRAFEERRKAGFGHFISEDVLRKNDNRLLSEILIANIPGVLLIRRAGGTAYLASGRKHTQGRVFGNPDSILTCFVTIYTDGVLTYNYTMERAGVPQDAVMRPDFSRLAVHDYAGVEFYASGATFPPGISPVNNDCGVLLLWTRER